MIVQVREVADWLRMMNETGVDNWWDSDRDKYDRIMNKIEVLCTTEEKEIFFGVYVNKDKTCVNVFNRKPWYCYKILNALEYKISRIYKEEFK